MERLSQEKRSTTTLDLSMGFVVFKRLFYSLKIVSRDNGSALTRKTVYYHMGLNNEFCGSTRMPLKFIKILIFLNFSILTPLMLLLHIRPQLLHFSQFIQSANPFTFYQISHVNPKTSHFNTFFQIFAERSSSFSILTFL